MERLFRILFFLLIVSPAGAQNTYVLLRRQLDTVVVTEKYIRKNNDVSVGTRISSISPTVLEGNQTRSLSELLSNNSMVYIKSLGQGAMATSSFRGTSSTHTQVNWNGFNINPAMSSSFDFSQIPVFFIDNVTLYHGNSHLKNGTGGIGGSINIANQPDWNDTTRVRAFAEYGANDTYTGAASMRFLGKKTLFQTRAYYQQSENDFRYLNKVLKKDPFYERRKESEYKHVGAMQEAYVNLDEYSNISSNLWFQYGDRHLPQPVIVNVTNHEKQKDISLKYFLGYDYTKDKHRVSAKTAYLLNTLAYKKWFDNDYFAPDGSFNRSQSIHVKGDYQYMHSSLFGVNASLMYAHDMVDASNYTSGRITRNVLSLQGSVLWNLSSWLSLNGQVMGEMNDDKFAPTFSVGLASRIIPELLTAKANVAYNYKFPSLNDLYWQPGGNPNLVPEQGFSYDATLSLTPRIGNSWFFKVDATYYLMNIDNWIMWLPTMNWFWEPRNVQNVLSHGLELMTECEYIAGNFKGKIGINYTYSPSVNRERNFEEDNTYKKQLPYIPLNKANLRLGGDYKNLFFSYQICYTGVRYVTADESYHTNAYTIHDAEIGYHFKLRKKYKLTPKLQMSNLFNAYYESTQYYPMPLRSFAMSFMFTY